MASKNPTRQISAAEFPAWLQSKIGEQSISDFALSIGFKRQRLSNILNGHQTAGPKLLAALKKHGMVGERVYYEVKGE